MKNDGSVGVVSAGGQKQQQGRGNNGFIPTSIKALSSYLRIVSSGASTVASTMRSAASAASAIVERESESSHDQVHWAGFDELQFEGGISRQVLLLGCRYGFQVWDVEETNNVHNLGSRRDGPVSFMQILPKPVVSKQSFDKLADSRPLLIICADGSFSGGSNVHGLSANSYNGCIQHSPHPGNGCFIPTVVWFYSLRSETYVHLLKFRSVVHLVRCSSRVVAILQATQIHCLNAATLEKEYTILTNPVVIGSPGSGGLGLGPLAVGPRWMAYSGSPIAVSNSTRVSPQHLTPSASFPGPASNGSLVAHYAKESSKQLAAGIVTLGDMGYKKLSRYYSELLPDGNNSQSGGPRVRVQGIANGHSLDADSVGMVIVRDTVSKTVVAQFKAHKSPISSLCFDPSGTLLVTASVQGHNINVFRIMPGLSSKSSGADSGSSYVHLYRLQRGLTNAVIQDISFSHDSQWILVSSSRGTSHLFAISPSGGPVSSQFADASFSDRNGGSSIMVKRASQGAANSSMQVLNQQSVCASGPPVTLSVVSRIRSGNSGWRNTVSGAAAAATGKISPVSGAIASAFRKGNDVCTDTSFWKKNYHLLLFSPPGCLIQYTMHGHSGLDAVTTLSGVDVTYDSGLDTDPRIVLEAIQKWNICQRQGRKEREDNFDIYGETGSLDSSKIFPEGMGRENGGYSAARSTITKDRLSLEERHHLFISEAELQTHQSPVPLWDKPEICFQSVVADGININGEGGEIEIEKIPTRTIEVRSKDLVPVYNYLQAPKLQEGRIAFLNSNNNGLLMCQRSDVSDNTKLASWSSESVDSIPNGGMFDTELYNGTEESGLDGLQMPMESIRGFVNNEDSPKAKACFETVNNSYSAKMETTLKLVNNNVDGLKMENQIEYRGDEFD